MYRYFRLSRLDFLILSSYTNASSQDFDVITGTSYEESEILTMSADVLITFASANIAIENRSDTTQKFKIIYNEG